MEEISRWETRNEQNNNPTDSYRLSHLCLTFLQNSDYLIHIQCYISYFFIFFGKKKHLYELCFLFSLFILKVILSQVD